MSQPKPESTPSSPTPAARTLERSSRAVRAVLLGYTIYGERASSREDWYIRVISPEGGYAYDGWWKDSADKPPAKVVAEAVRGACVLEGYEPCPVCKSVPAKPDVPLCCGCFECDFIGTLGAYERTQQMNEEAQESFALDL